MKWSFRIATVAGIPIYLHATFVALIVFLFVQDWLRGEDLAAALAGIFFILSIFGTVVLHEFGHALMARHYGVQTKDITLLPIGGLARLERLPDVPRQELWVALAGPAVNLGLAAITGLVLLVTDTVPEAGEWSRAQGFLPRFLLVNVWLALFNLIPAFPMDGGRALRALLAERMDYVRATETAARLGQGLALVFSFFGLFTNPFLVFIALFVWMGASAEASSVSLRSAIAGIPVARAMITDFRTVEATDTLGHAASLIIAGSQRDFPVLDGGQLAGILTRDALVKAIAAHGVASRVREAMTTAFERVDAREMLERALEKLQQCECPVLPVMLGDRLVGLLTADNVGEYVMIQGAIPQQSR